MWPNDHVSVPSPLLESESETTSFIKINTPFLARGFPRHVHFMVNWSILLISIFMFRLAATIHTLRDEFSQGQLPLEIWNGVPFLAAFSPIFWNFGLNWAYFNEIHRFSQYASYKNTVFVEYSKKPAEMVKIQGQRRKIAQRRRFDGIPTVKPGKLAPKTINLSFDAGFNSLLSSSWWTGPLSRV